MINIIKTIRAKLRTFQRRSLKETSTRTIIIDPILEALGWDVRDPDVVTLEYSTVDNKFVDYALILNKKPVLFVEAKALVDNLEDVKALTQLIGYAANNGVVWCILTNGIKWRVYRSVEKCAAPDKLMFEVNIAPKESDEIDVEQIAKQMWRFSSVEMAVGALDKLGQITFTDSKVRKALQSLMLNPSKGFINLLRKVVNDNKFEPKIIKDSLGRIANDASIVDSSFIPSHILKRKGDLKNKEIMSNAAKKAWETRRSRSRLSQYDEAHHISEKS